MTKTGLSASLATIVTGVPTHSGATEDHEIVTWSPSLNSGEPDKVEKTAVPPAAKSMV